MKQKLSLRFNIYVIHISLIYVTILLVPETTKYYKILWFYMILKIFIISKTFWDTNSSNLIPFT